MNRTEYNAGVSFYTKLLHRLLDACIPDREMEEKILKNILEEIGQHPRAGPDDGKG